MNFSLPPRHLLGEKEGSSKTQVKCHYKGCKTPPYWVSTEFLQQLDAAGKRVTCRHCISMNKEFVDHSCAKCGEFFLTMWQETQLRKRMTEEGKKYWRPACCKKCVHGA